MNVGSVAVIHQLCPSQANVSLHCQSKNLAVNCGVK
jgi:hypothetical protein